MSRPAFAKATPVTPPTVNKKIKPSAKSKGVVKYTCPPHIVANQLKILMPVGTAIIIVAAVKYALTSTSIPTVYIWCAHTMNPKKPIEIIA